MAPSRRRAAFSHAAVGEPAFPQAGPDLGRLGGLAALPSSVGDAGTYLVRLTELRLSGRPKTKTSQISGALGRRREIFGHSDRAPTPWGSGTVDSRIV